MAIKYSVSERRNPLRPDEPKKWYATTKSAGDVTLRAISKAVSLRCTVNPADTQAVIVALTQVISETLNDGKIARLGDFGSFQLGIGSDGAESEEKFNASLIRTKKVVFRPGIDLREMLKNLTFEKE